MTDLNTIFGGGGGGGGGGGVPLGGLIEAQANMPDLPGFVRVNKTRILSKADYPAAAEAIGDVADNAPFVNPLAPIADGAVNHQAQTSGPTPISGTPYEIKCLDGADLWAIRVGTKVYLSSTGPTGEWTDTGLTISNASFQEQMAYANGYIVLVNGQNDDRGIYVNDNQNDYTSWTEFYGQGASQNGNDYHYFVEHVGSKFFVGFKINGSQANTAWYLYVCDDGVDVSNAANWTRSDLLWASPSNYGTSRSRTPIFFYDEIDDIYVAIQTEDEDVQDREYWYMKTSTDGLTWTTHPDHNSYTATNDNMWGGYPYRMPDGTRLVLYTYDNIDRYRVFGNGWDAAHTAQESITTGAHQDLASEDRQRFQIDLIDATGNSIIFFNGSNGDELAKYTWNGNGFDVSNTPNSQLFDIYFDNQARGFDLDELDNMIYVPHKGAFYALVHQVDPANTNHIYVWEYPLYSYDTTTEFAVLGVPHTDDPDNIVYQARVE